MITPSVKLWNESPNMIIQPERPWSCSPWPCSRRVLAAVVVVVAPEQHLLEEEEDEDARPGAGRGAPRDAGCSRTGAAGCRGTPRPAARPPRSSRAWRSSAPARGRPRARRSPSESAPPATQAARIQSRVVIRSSFEPDESAHPAALLFAPVGEEPVALGEGAEIRRRRRGSRPRARAAGARARRDPRGTCPDCTGRRPPPPPDRPR